jgi:hypothetical protein
MNAFHASYLEAGLAGGMKDAGTATVRTVLAPTNRTRTHARRKQ